ncbi:P1 family peptidase [uncultured Cardiobacterium sp.]|uniref:DmpA family aminopeptidase n=1 Tax=uncultured Cardiobacterium sp. TaxID=417619 RepID=UPI0026273B61|nr:P1 family peptidase [uncultured Cardiobacterium sp.]
MTTYHEARLQLLLDYWRRHRRLPPGNLPTGPHDRLSDVPGVRVGHSTLADGDCQSGVTAIIPAGGNLFTDPLPCGVAVLNGFGKSTGLIQIAELGTLETPLLLTNTLSVGTCYTALVQHAVAENPDIGRESATVNPVVLECNDGYLNDIQRLAVSEAMAAAALTAAQPDFARGAVGAGRGMSCFGLKGGIGTASRRVGAHTLGLLVLANFGRLPDIRLDGIPCGDALQQALDAAPAPAERGSIITIMATDAPLDARQLTRLAKRAGAGLGRLGSHWGHGSGDINLAFSTDRSGARLHPESALDDYFRAAADGTEYAVRDALLSAATVSGFCGHRRVALPELLDRLASV